MPGLKKGVDSLETRIWCSSSDGVFTLFNIRYIYNEWHITKTRIWDSYPERVFNRYDTVNHLLEVRIDSTRSWPVTPVCGKPKFIDSLFQVYLHDFPYSADLSGSYTLPMDGPGFTLEVAEKDKYQFVSYACPANIMGKLAIHRRYSNLIGFIQRNLDKNILPCFRLVPTAGQ
jgi:hypothetical protein